MIESAQQISDKPMQPLKFTHDLTTFQLKAARYALNFKLQEITRLTGVAGSTVLRIESGDLYSFPGRAKLSTITKLRQLYESYGIVFYHPCGLTLQPLSNVFKGKIPEIINFEEDTL